MKYVNTYMGQPITVKTAPPTQPVLGDSVYDGNTHTFKIYDGKQWLEISAEMMSIPHGQSGTWLSEDELLCSQHPGLADLRREMELAKEKYEAFKALVKE